MSTRAASRQRRLSTRRKIHASLRDADGWPALVPALKRRATFNRRYAASCLFSLFNSVQIDRAAEDGFGCAVAVGGDESSVCGREGEERRAVEVAGADGDVARLFARVCGRGEEA
jgi:hypothetical protein